MPILATPHLLLSTEGLTPDMLDMNNISLGKVHRLMKNSCFLCTFHQFIYFPKWILTVNIPNVSQIIEFQDANKMNDDVISAILDTCTQSSPRENDFVIFDTALARFNKVIRRGCLFYSSSLPI